jgi:Ca2+/Na+ antiporter
MAVMNEVVIALFILFLLPFIVFYGAVLAIWIGILTPFLLVVFLLFRWYKKRKQKLNPIPDDAVPYTPEEAKKPIMVKWQGKELPLYYLIWSCVLVFLSITLGIVLLLAGIVLWFPWPVSMAIVFIAIGIGIGKLG